MILERLKKGKLLLLDGGFGTELQKRNAGLLNSAIANFYHPDIVMEIHRSYVEAGADIITTNTGTANRVGLKKADEWTDPSFIVEKYNLAALDNIKRAVNGRLVAGSISTIGKPVAMSEGEKTDEYFISWQDALELFNEQARVLKDGINLYLIETMIDLNEGVLALEACKRYGLPVAISFRIEQGSNRTLFGNTIGDIVMACRQADIIGANCIEGIEASIKIAREFRDKTGLPLIVYPNAGMPDEHNLHPESPGFMASKLPQLLEAGVNIIGGCCGTTPEHIRRFRTIMDGYIK